MAKANRKTTSSKNQPIKEALTKLRDFYKLGQEVLKADEKNPLKRKYSHGVVKEFATKLGVAENFVYKARVFAKKYTQSEFRELCELRQPDGMPLGCWHVIALLRIRDTRERKRFQKRVAKKGLSTRQLTTEISQKLGLGRHAGRIPKSPKTVDEALMQVLTMTRKWSRWFDGFDPENESEEDRIFLDDLPKEVAASIKQISGKIVKFREITEREREKLQKRSRRKKR